MRHTLHVVDPEQDGALYMNYPTYEAALDAATELLTWDVEEFGAMVATYTITEG